MARKNSEAVAVMERTQTDPEQRQRHEAQDADRAVGRQL